ncbi:MAG: hypothetical protein PVG39_00480 [Desulfobacteraceae bacterium]|jgi:hypothetical protein
MKIIDKLINEVIDYARPRNDVIIEEIILEHRQVHPIQELSHTSGTENINPKIFAENIKPFLRIKFKIHEIKN